MRDSTLIITGLALILISVIYFSYDLGFLMPPEFEGERKVTINKPVTAGSVARTLKREGIIRSAADFTLYAVLSGNAGSIKPGSYSFTGGLSSPEVVGIITR